MLPENYHSLIRTEIEGLLPLPLGRVLEVGCASGATLRWLKEAHGAIRTIGLEINGDLKADLERNIDVALIGTAEDLDLVRPYAPFDTILFLDVLEHLVDPWSVVEAYSEMISDGGSIIASIPNISHFNVMRRILSKNFGYQKAGILDVTHLRFFSLRTATDLMSCGELTPVSLIKVLGPKGGRNKLISAMSFGALDDYFTVQYIVKSRKVSAASFDVQRVWTRYPGVEGNNHYASISGSSPAEPIGLPT